MLELKENDPKTFEIWQSPSNRETWGSHPWEVCRGGNSTHIDLAPVKNEKGYYFHLAGESYGRAVETSKFFLALHKAGYPTQLDEANGMADRFMGTSKIGIVPTGVIPRYCESYFPGEEIFDFMNLFSEDFDLLSYIKWQEIEEVELANGEKEPEGAPQAKDRRQT